MLNRVSGDTRLVAIHSIIAYLLQTLVVGSSLFTKASIKRILLVRTDRLGDVILTLPMLSALRRCFPDAYIAMLLRRYTGEILEGNPHLNELIWYDRDHANIPLGEMIATLRMRRFDVAIVVYPRLRLAWLLWRAGIPLRIGTGYRYYSFLFNKRVFEHRKDAKRHEVEYNLNLLRELSCDRERDLKAEFYIAVPPEAENNIETLLRSLGIERKGFVIVHPGSGGSAREWSPENFGRLAARLASDFHIVVTGTSSEEAKVSAVVRASGNAAIPLVGKCTLKELAALIGASSLFVSNSTGPLHLAVAMGTPVVGLYPQHTAMSAKRWGPYTGNSAVFVPERPLDCNTCVEHNSACECMATITVEAVLAAARSLLAKHQAGMTANV
jgi:heptosyltransferase-2